MDPVELCYGLEQNLFVDLQPELLLPVGPDLLELPVRLSVELATAAD